MRRYLIGVYMRTNLHGREDLPSCGVGVADGKEDYVVDGSRDLRVIISSCQPEPLRLGLSIFIFIELHSISKDHSPLYRPRLLIPKMRSHQLSI